MSVLFFFFQAEDGIRDLVRSRGLGDVYKRQPVSSHPLMAGAVQDFMDFLEVAFHTILFSRQIYPKEVFEKRKRYGIPVWMSRHPELNQYISDFIQSTRPWLQQVR
eukprot:TRINITY_DN17228_c0_g1_i3.p1 TRINITY_DN17228_c0_g1~~TRINITY_DN17228_c0_g1_i3.p1  ORF type:complete len:106 (+),score=24.72 TRINITY_DN17228_c0_g1_i3:75-392(+)